MNERQGYFDRRTPSNGRESSQVETDDARVEEARFPTSDAVGATARAIIPTPTPPPIRRPTQQAAISAPISTLETAAELERQARLLEQAAVDAAAAVRQAGQTVHESRGSDAGTDVSSRRPKTAKGPDHGADFGELQRKAERFYTEALRARLRADAAAEKEAPGAVSVPVEAEPDPSEAMRVVSWNRPELDWTTLIAAAIEEGDEAADTDAATAPRRTEVAVPVAHDN